MNYAEALHFAENLMAIMDRKGLTNYKLAKLIPCSPSTVANWRNGAIPRGLVRNRLMEVLNVTEEELFGDNKKSPAPKEGEADPDFDTFIRILSALDPDERAQLLAHGRALVIAHEALGKSSKSQ